MKQIIVPLLFLLLIFCFYHFLLGLMHLESLVLTGCAFFLVLLGFIRILTWQH